MEHVDFADFDESSKEDEKSDKKVIENKKKES